MNFMSQEFQLLLQDSYERYAKSHTFDISWDNPQYQFAKGELIGILKVCLGNSSIAKQLSVNIGHETLITLYRQCMEVLERTHFEHEQESVE